LAGTTTQPRFRVVDDPTINEIYANQFISASYDGRSVTLTFGTTRPIPERIGEGNSDEVPLQVHIFEMSPAAATDMINSIEGMLKDSGVLREEPQPGGGWFSGGNGGGDTWGR
jgi:hypothetical protein